MIKIKKLLLLTLFVLFGTGAVFAQRQVTGTVIDDATSETLPFVTVQVKGITGGTVTDVQGRFTITVPSAESVLVFSFLGYQTLELEASTVAPMTVRMQSSATALEGVVITGMFERRKESFTGSAITVTAEELRRVGNQNILQSLGNIDPSFIITESIDFGSDPNRLPDIVIRGESSIAGLQGEFQGNPNEPLFVLDGFIVSAQQIFDLDMNRVQSVTILKDAAATAIYGSRAANGVVVVETILPQAGRLRVTYTGDLNIQAPDLTVYNLTNAREKLQAEVNAGRWTSSGAAGQQGLDVQYNEILKNIVRGVDTDWLAQPVRLGIGQRHSLRLEGGDAAMRYGVDFSYNNVAGVMKGSNRETVSGSINLSYRYKNLTFRNVLSVTFNTANDSPYGSFSQYAQLNPYWSPYDENGNVNMLLGIFTPYSAGGSAGTTVNTYNPLYNATVGTKNFSTYNEVRENFYAEWQIFRDLKLTGRFGFTYQGNKREDFLPGTHTNFAEMVGDDFFRRGTYSISNGELQNLNTDIVVNYSKQIGKHLIFANAGWNLLSATGNSNGMRAEGFLNNRVDHITFARQYQLNGRPFGSESITREVGIIGAANYSYDNRYLADVSIRANASSVYGADNRWGTFWSAGLGWNLHNEQFWGNSDIVNQLRIRGSVGTTGSQSFNPFQAMRTYNFFADRTYDGIPGAYLMAMANNNLRWQQTLARNIGVDVGLFKTINLRFDAYLNTVNDLLIDFTLPPSTGFNSFRENLGSVENKGFDATASWRVWSNPAKHAFISLNASISHNTQKLKNISDALRNFNADQDAGVGTSPLTRYAEGQSMSVLWAVQSLGIDPITGREIFSTKDGERTYIWRTEDQIIAGDANPKARGNFGFSGEYMGFGLSASLRYQFGGDMYNHTLVNRVENVNIANNVDRRVFEGTWVEPGDHTFFRRITTSPTTTRPTTRFVERHNELSMASVSAYYDFKLHNMKKYGMERLRVSFFMNDVFRLSTVEIERGLDYPFARTFSFQVTATF
jgi:TonB-linked SusC/RagA family outer membrane protein